MSPNARDLPDRLLLRGKRNREIADACKLAVETVEQYNSQIYAIMECKGRIEPLGPTCAWPYTPPADSIMHQYYSCGQDKEFPKANDRNSVTQHGMPLSAHNELR
jgi:hypothetical protein